MESIKTPHSNWLESYGKTSGEFSNQLEWGVFIAMPNGDALWYSRGNLDDQYARWYELCRRDPRLKRGLPSGELTKNY